MICKHNMHIAELNKEREKKGLPPVDRRQFCKFTAASAAAFGIAGLAGCDAGGSSGAGGSGEGAAVGGCGEGPTEAGTAADDYVKQKLGQDSRANTKVRAGTPIDFYGEVDFRSDLRYSDFSKKGLANLVKMASVYHNGIQNSNRAYQFNTYDDDRAVNAEKSIWGTSLVHPINKIITRVMRIRGKDLESFMKQMQLELNTMASDEHNDVYYEMPSKRRGLITFNKCTIAQQYEARGELGQKYLPKICDARCANYLQKCAQKFDKDIVVKNVVKPPRPSEDHICCKWEIYYKSDGSQTAKESHPTIDPSKMDSRMEIEDRAGVDLKDYSGPFRPNLRISDFTRHRLAELYLAYHRYDLTMILGYQAFEMATKGYNAGTDMQVVVWAVELAEVARTTMMKYMKTNGSGIKDFFKALQVDITAQPPNFENEFKMVNENTGLYTFHKCFGLTMNEPVGTDEDVIAMCELDPPAIGNSARDMYSRGLPAGKGMDMEIITMPPRTYTDEVCCQWKIFYVNT